MSCSRFGRNISASVLDANFDSYDPGAQTINTTGSIGDFVRIRIRRGAAFIETSAGQVNTGFDVISYATTLQNGDELIVEVSDTSLFVTTDQESVFIPTPGITSPTLMPNLQFSFEAAPAVDAFIAPNSGGADLLTWTFDFLDNAGNTGTITMVGPKSAFQDTDDVAAYVVNPTTGVETIITSFGNISVNRVFDPGFTIELNKTVIGSLTDQLGMQSAEDYCGITCALFADTSTYLIDDAGDPLTYLVLP